MEEIEETDYSEVGVELIKEDKPKSIEIVSEREFKNAWKNWAYRETKKKKAIKEKDSTDGNPNDSDKIKDPNNAKDPNKNKANFTAEVPQAKKDGIMRCSFSQKLKVPSFIVKDKKEKRKRML